MLISAVGNSTYLGPPRTESSAAVRQAFDNLGTAINAGNLDDATKALAVIQKNAPPDGGRQPNPMGERMDALAKAVDSGSTTAAQSAYADLQRTMAQTPRRAGGGQPSGATAPTTNAAAKTTTTTAGATTNTSLFYDKADANQDGVVSPAEQFAYDLKHPAEAALRARPGSLLNTIA